jgi:2-iminobutanoate/2-iminopropanoate deaminase
VNDVRIIHSPAVPPPGGHYSHAVAHAGVLYISGQLGRGPGLSDADAGDIIVQTRRAMASIEAIAAAAGSSLARLIKVNIYISDIAHWPAVNAEYARILGDHRPARAIVPVNGLHYGALVEIDAIAALIA